jgi:type II secretory pathway component GspD/PulD (secretin)
MKYFLLAGIFMSMVCGFGTGSAQTIAEDPPAETDASDVEPQADAVQGQDGVPDPEGISDDAADDAQETDKVEEDDVIYVPQGVNMNQRITLDLRNMDVKDALTYIALRSGANIVASKAVTGRVSLQLKEVPLQDVFDITLLTNDLAYEKRGDIFYIMTAKEYQDRYGRSFGDIRKVKMHHLKYAIPEKAFDLLDTLKSTIGRILVDQESGTVLIVDTEDKIKEMEEALYTLEKKGEVNVFDLQYAVAKDVEDRLRVQLDDKNVGSIWSDERSNQVVVRALPGRMSDVKEIIAALDKKTQEVLIDAKIVNVKLSDEMAAGFEWEGFFKDLTGDGFLGSHPLQPIERVGQTAIDDFTTIQPTEANPAAGSKKSFMEEIYFGRTSKNKSFEVLFKFLQTIGDTRLLSNPKLAVVNNQEARIHVGRKEAYITTTTTSGQTTSTTAEEVTFVDVGIQLSVTPTINEEGFITMKIKPEVSSVVDVLVTPSGNQIPIIDTSLAETTVMVKDNATIIIGGLRREQEGEASERVPFLADIPLLGRVFRSEKKNKEHSELLVMITPHIVDGSILTTGEVEPGEDGLKPLKEYEAFEAPAEESGPEIGRLEYKSFRDDY